MDYDYDCESECESDAFVKKVLCACEEHLREYVESILYGKTKRNGDIDHASVWTCAILPRLQNAARVKKVGATEVVTCAFLRVRHTLTFCERVQIYDAVRCAQDVEEARVRAWMGALFEHAASAGCRNTDDDDCGMPCKCCRRDCDSVDTEDMRYVLQHYPQWPLDDILSTSTLFFGGGTALHWAVDLRSQKRVRLLLEHGADPNAMDANHCSVTDFAAEQVREWKDRSRCENMPSVYVQWDASTRAAQAENVYASTLMVDVSRRLLAATQ